MVKVRGLALFDFSLGHPLICGGFELVWSWLESRMTMLCVLYMIHDT